MTVSNTRFLPKAYLYIKSKSRAPKAKSYLFIFWAFSNSDKLLMQIQSHYIADQFLILKHCCCKNYLKTSLINSQSWYLAEVYPVLLHRWPIPTLTLLINCWEKYCVITSLSYNLFLYIFKPCPTLTHCCRNQRDFVRLSNCTHEISTKVTGPLFQGSLWRINT